MRNYPSSPLGNIPTVIIVIYIAVAILSAVAAWKVFVKAGKSGWAVLIPFYNYIVLCEIVGKPIWWFLLMICPCINFIFLIWVVNLLSKSFGKSEGFTAGLIILHPIFIMILGFGDAVYLGPAAAEANAGNRFGSSDYQKPFDNDIK